MGYGTETSNPEGGLFDCLFIGYDIRMYHGEEEWRRNDRVICRGYGIYYMNLLYINNF